MANQSMNAFSPPCKLIVAGCGPHFRQIYLKILSQWQHLARIVLIVDLQSQEETVRTAMSAADIIPEAFLFLPDSWRRKFPDGEPAEILDRYLATSSADAIVICTEPRAHRPFAEWAMERKLSVFMDKPISAFSGTANRANLLADFQALSAMQMKHDTFFVVSCERRQHFGYRYVFDFLKDFMERDGSLITNVNVHFGGGNLLSESEYLGIENHPFKYGYGILLHSGYHYVDLIARLMALNETLAGIPLEPEVASFFRTDVSRPVPSPCKPQVVADDDRGEFDVVAAGFYSGLQGQRMTFGLQLLGNTVSAREANSPLEDSPPHGRLRQEYVTIHLGNSCSIIICDNGFGKLDDEVQSCNFQVTIALGRFSVAGGTVYTLDRRKLSSIYPECPRSGSLNKHARGEMFQRFLLGDDCNSSLNSHRNSVTLLQKIYNEAR